MTYAVKPGLRSMCNSGLGRRASILLHDSLYWILRRADPNLTTGGFYARINMWLIRAGLPHKTLGPRLNERFEGRDDKWIVLPAGKSTLGCRPLQQLLELGLRPEDTVVDFGCGTLRVGRHLINYLAPGAYWGLDVNDDLLRLARNMLEVGQLKGKRPNIARITPENLMACAAARPRFVIAIAVAIHVPPDELDRFCRQVCGLGNRETVFYLTFSATTRSARTSGTCWSYAPEDFSAAFQRSLPDHEVATQLGRAKGRFNGASIHSATLLATPRRARRLVHATHCGEREET